MSVVGFGDLPEVRWPLTTVRRLPADTATPAVRAVPRPTRDEQPDSLRVEPGTDLVVRAGTTAPAGRG
ncbi:hypothetical protein KYY02_31680 [Streptomyces pimonensis]|uniref:Uncharacterized protein n=1 Tax=Streptomyces pimonensis TaxID=2860288 RepID=A0ABV4JAQ1_9ACTN